jgi:hypothetical protein
LPHKLKQKVLKHSNYLLPNFINVIYKKVDSNLRSDDIDLTRFNQYCLAVQLYHLKRYSDKIASLPFSEKDEQLLNRLCSVCGFRPEREEEGETERMLTGLSPHLPFGDSEVITKIQLLVNYFCEYEVLKNTYKQSSLEYEYDNVCTDLESLRIEFRLPARFKYNKFKRRDNPFFKGGVEVIIPEDDAPVTSQSSDQSEIPETDTPTANPSIHQPETPEGESLVLSHSNGQSETQIDDSL